MSGARCPRRRLRNGWIARWLIIGTIAAPPFHRKRESDGCSRAIRMKSGMNLNSVILVKTGTADPMVEGWGAPLTRRTANPPSTLRDAREEVGMEPARQDRWTGMGQGEDMAAAGGSALRRRLRARAAPLPKAGAWR